MNLTLEEMRLEDIPQVLEVDRECYTLPWPASTYRREILHNRNARYLVLREDREGVRNETEDAPRREEKPRLPFPFFRKPSREEEEARGAAGRLVGYAGMWVMVGEAHVTTIAIRNEARGRGLGELLLCRLMQLATEMQASRVTLEVRVSNEAAQNLYRKYGFHQDGLRKRYYSDNNEDAYIMSTDDLHTPVFQSALAKLTTQLQDRLGQQQDTVNPPLRALADTSVA